MKKARCWIAAVVMLLLFIPAAALAADHPVTSGTFDLSTCLTGDTVTVAAGATATLTGTAPGNVAVSCGAGVTLTLSGANIDNSSSGTCALSFTGAGNTLILSGANSLQSGTNFAGVSVGDSVSLTITGSGSLDVNGGDYAAGIGGGANGDGGVISISGGTIVANGGYNGAGIGGGVRGNGGTISITGGAITANGGYCAAGIGGGYGADGIGGGAGIITISGGLTYAQYGFCEEPVLRDDIGCGGRGSGGSLTISNTAAVFLENDACITPSLPNGHEHKTPSDVTDPLVFSGNTVYGLTVPADWTGSSGGYFRLYTVTYDPNGGSGTPPSSPPVQHIGTSVTVAGGSGLTKANAVFSGWNTLANGSGIPYAAGSSLTLASNITLYVMWKAPVYSLPQTGDTSSVSLYAGLAVLSLLGAIAVSERRRRNKDFR